MTQKIKTMQIELPVNSFCPACGSFDVTQVPFRHEVKCQKCCYLWATDSHQSYDRICVWVDAGTEIGFRMSSITSWIYYRMERPVLKVNIEGQKEAVTFRGDTAKSIHEHLRSSSKEIFQEEVTQNVTVTGYARL